MSKLSDTYLKRVSNWLVSGLKLKNIHMALDQKFRARMAYEAYLIWLNNKQINVSRTMQNIAQRDYDMLLERASMGDEDARQYVEFLHIEPDKPRSPSEIANDVYLFNYIISTFQVDTTAIERAKVLDASDWLINHGMKNGNDRSVSSGAKLKMDLHNNFDEKQDAASQLPNPELSITGDVSVAGRTPVSQQEKQKLLRKYDLTEAEFDDMYEQPDGSWSVNNDIE